MCVCVLPKFSLIDFGQEFAIVRFVRVEMGVIREIVYEAVVSIILS